MPRVLLLVLLSSTWNPKLEYVSSAFTTATSDAKYAILQRNGHVSAIVEYNGDLSRHIILALSKSNYIFHLFGVCITEAESVALLQMYHA